MKGKGREIKTVKDHVCSAKICFYFLNILGDHNSVISAEVKDRETIFKANALVHKKCM